MKLELNDFEYNDLVEDILANKEFRKLENFIHHKTDRLEHSKRVSLYSYKICKMLKLDYVSAARGGLLHDFSSINIKENLRLVLWKTILK